MTENSSQLNVNEASVNRKVRVGMVFLSLIPLSVFLMIQSVSQFPFLFLAMAEAYQSEAYKNAATVTESTRVIMDIFNSKYAIPAYLIYSIAGLIVFSIWYYKAFVKKGPRIKISQVFGVKSVIAMIGTALCFDFVINAGMTLVSMLMPKIIEDYNLIVEMSGLVTNIWITVIYVIFLAPLLEELVFRGVIYSYLEKSGIKPGLIILITGLAFGIVHFNLVQSTYACILGIFLGFLRYKYRSIKITVLTHAMINLMGTYGEEAVGKLGLNNGANLIIGGIAMVLLVFIVVLINSDKKAVGSSHNNP